MVLIWELTQACGLSCKHCRASAQPERHPEELSTAEGKRFLDDVREFGEGQLIVFSGGDPLYRDDAMELIQYGLDIGLTVTLTPSGTAGLTPDRVRRLRTMGLRRLALSFDGATPTAHDRFRQERGSFERTLAAARAANASGLPVQVNTTVCADTAPELPEIRDLVADLDAVLWSVFFLVPIGRGRILEPVRPERADAIMEWIAEVEASSEFRVKTTEAPQYRRVRVQAGETAGRPGIVAGDGFAFVSHTGELYPSGFLPKSVGNVRANDVVTLYRSAPLFRRLRDREELVGKCGACAFRGVCGGSRSRAYAYTGDPLESDPLCPHVPDGYEGPRPVQAFHPGAFEEPSA